MTDTEMIQFIEDNRLDVRPIVIRDEAVSWSTSRRMLDSSGRRNISMHGVHGAVSFRESVEKWATIYGPNPSHGLQVGMAVDVQGSSPGVVFKLGRWFAVVGSPEREPGHVELSRLTPSTKIDLSLLFWNWSADLGAASSFDCDSPDQ